MDIDKLAEKIRDVVLGEIKDEFGEFRASVTGELSGFRVAIEGINGRISSIESRQSNIEQDLRDIRRAIEDTNKRIDRLYEVVVRREDHEKMEFRLIKLEQEVAAIKEKVA